MFIADASQWRILQSQNDVYKDSGDHERGLCKDDGCFEAA